MNGTVGAALSGMGERSTVLDPRVPQTTKGNGMRRHIGTNRPMCNSGWRPRPPSGARRTLLAALAGASVASFVAYIAVLVVTDSSAWASLLALTVVILTTAVAEVLWAPSRLRIEPDHPGTPR